MTWASPYPLPGSLSDGSPAVFPLAQPGTAGVVQQFVKAAAPDQLFDPVVALLKYTMLFFSSATFSTPPPFHAEFPTMVQFTTGYELPKCHHRDPSMPHFRQSDIRTWRRWGHTLRRRRRLVRWRPSSR